MEPGEAFEEAARREVFEETGITGGQLREVLHLMGPAPSGFRQLNLEAGVFRLALEVLPNVTLNPAEHSEFRWVALAELVSLRMMELNRSVAVIALADLASRAGR